MDRSGRKGALLVAMFLVLCAFGTAPAPSPAAEHDHGAPMESLGERIYQGTSGPWNIEARLIDMKAQLEKSGVSAKAIAQLAAKHHLMVILTDPKTGKSVTGVAGEVTITGPDKASSSKVRLVAMGSHIGADVSLPKPGKYTFRVEVTGGGQRGSAVFDHLPGK